MGNELAEHTLRAAFLSCHRAISATWTTAVIAGIWIGQSGLGDGPMDRDGWSLLAGAAVCLLLCRSAVRGARMMLWRAVTATAAVMTTAAMTGPHLAQRSDDGA